MQHNDVFKTLLAQTASSAVQLAGAAAVKAFNDLMSAAGVLVTDHQGATDQPTELYAHEVMALVSTGDEVPWPHELDLLWTRHRMETLAMLDSVIATGIRHPITIGNDGRLWDGHHRVAIAAALGIKVPVQYAATHRDGYRAHR